MSIIYGSLGTILGPKVSVDINGRLQIDNLSGGYDGAQYSFGDDARLAGETVRIHTGTAALVVRKDADQVNTLFNDEGQYSHLTVGSRGELYCSQVPTSLTNIVNIADIHETGVGEISTNGTCIKNMYLFNKSADTPIWLKVYNAAAGNVTPGITAPNLDILVGPNSSRHFEFSSTDGVIFGTALSVSASTAPGTPAVGIIEPNDLSGVFIISAYT